MPFLTKWLEEFIRVVKDAWARLGTLVGVISGRIEVLEKRVSDTYTWGSGSITVDKIIALPLRVVRSEVLVEFTIAAETASTSGDVQIELRQNGATLINGTLSTGATFVGDGRRRPTGPRGQRQAGGDHACGGHWREGRRLSRPGAR